MRKIIHTPAKQVEMVTNKLKSLFNDVHQNGFTIEHLKTVKNSIEDLESINLGHSLTIDIPDGLTVQEAIVKLFTDNPGIELGIRDIVDYVGEFEYDSHDIKMETLNLCGGKLEMTKSWAFKLIT